MGGGSARHGEADTGRVGESETGPGGTAAAGRVAQPVVGSFRFWFATRRWEWSEPVYRMHGYVPGAVEPTTELLLGHKHPDDRPRVAALIARAVERGEPFSSRHRFLDTSGVEHQVLVVADRITEPASGAVVGTGGFYIDLTDTLTDTENVVLGQALPEVVEARAVIEQAKGILMHAYRISAEQAFQLLVWRSQETNTKLRSLAVQLVADLALLPPLGPDAGNTFDPMLLTVHQRVPSSSRERRDD